jgi:hypothetical protein
MYNARPITEKNNKIIGHAAFSAGVTCLLAVKVSYRTQTAAIARYDERRLSEELKKSEAHVIAPVDYRIAPSCSSGGLPNSTLQPVPRKGKS